MAYRCVERLWLTEKGEVVHDGDPRARTLFATPGMELVEKPKVLEFHREGAKAVRKGEDKALRPSEDK
jgi:hypothetical protein